MLTLEGKVALVTGAAQGIGAACARELARHGADTVLLDIAFDRLQETAAGIMADTGRRVVALACDVADPEACASVFAQAVETCGGVDILLNNAAVLRAGDILDLDLADFDTVMAVNLRPAFVMSQLAARHMRDTGRKGAIINMSSINAVLAIPNQLAYVTAKGGLNQLTRAMALALAPHGIRVNAIGPGSIGTEMLQQVMTDDSARRTVLSRTPMGRVGEPAEIGRLAVFLASDYASYMTGQTLYADGGRLPLNYVVPVAD